MKTIYVATHDGVFHADEVFAVATLKRLYRDKEVVVIRTRNESEYKYADVIVDVGSRYDAIKYFDHHQRDFNEARSDGSRTPYSSAGLIWLHFGLQLCEGDAYLWQILDKELFEHIDAIDNGVKHPGVDASYSRLIGGYNPSWYEDADDAARLKAFHRAVEVAGDILENKLRYAKGEELALEVVRGAKQLFDGRVLVLERFAPWAQIVLNEMPEVLYVVFPASDGSWRIQATAREFGSYELKQALPAKWRGLNEKALISAIGEDVRARFCARNGFIAGAHDYDSIMRMAQLALDVA